MKRTKLLLIITALFSVLTVSAGTKSLKSFNEGWQFYRGIAEGAEQVDYDTSEWRDLDLPHDWAIEGPFSSEYNARCGGLPYHGTGWYRKEFDVSFAQEGRITNIIFDAAMNNATVWVNGVEVGRRYFGYVGFKFDITKYLKYGDKNVIAVRLTPEDHSSRWYPGAGLYRNVWISSDMPTHIPHWGTYVTTPTVTDAKAVVQVETQIKNDSDSEQPLTVQYEIIAPNDKVVAKKMDKITIAANSQKKIGIYMDVLKPLRWDLETPNMYTLKTKVVSHKATIDESETPFGIRQIAYDKDGFYLNGRKIKFNGVCIHHDNGPLGGELYERADERKIQIMKDMGANAIRTSHNPAAPEFLDLCDRMGMLVLCEMFDMWRVPKVPQGYSQYFDEWAVKDVESIIEINRNHPSLIMWSTGNEVQDQYEENGGWQTAKMLTEVCHRMDPTRPTTTGFHHYPAPYDQNMVQQVDIVGVNYHVQDYAAIRRDYPDLAIYGSEVTSGTSSRGVYVQPAGQAIPDETCQLSSYDYGVVGVNPMDMELHQQAEHPYSMGYFIWTGFDYLGEPSPYGGRDNSTHGYWNDNWPSHSSYFGAVDLVGLPKDRFYFYQSNWSDKPMVHLLPHWNWPGMEGDKIDVGVYTNCEEAELFLNGKSLGKKKKGVDLVEMTCYDKTQKKKQGTFKSRFRLRWEVPYEAGEIKVVGYNGGKPVSEKSIRTASEPAIIKLSADRTTIDADGRDLSYVTIRVEDKDGNLCPMADNLINFSVEGAGKLIAVGNGNSASLESFQAPHIKAFSGMCVAILRSEAGESGDMTLTATSDGLSNGVVSVETK